jgi:hypothetical protein
VKSWRRRPAPREFWRPAAHAGVAGSSALWQHGGSGRSKGRGAGSTGGGESGAVEGSAGRGEVGAAGRRRGLQGARQGVAAGWGERSGGAEEG